MASGTRSAQSGRLAAAIAIEIHWKPTENIENTLDNTQNTKKYRKIPRKRAENREKQREIPLKQGDWDKGTRLVALHASEPTENREKTPKTQWKTAKYPEK